jgi:predicted nucleic acid-binding protein
LRDIAKSGEVVTIVSGDKAHLIPMHPYRGIEVLSVGDFLLRVQRA